jgi:membrane protein involved in colicin uptake
MSDYVKSEPEPDEYYFTLSCPACGYFGLHHSAINECAARPCPQCGATMGLAFNQWDHGTFRPMHEPKPKETDIIRRVNQLRLQRNYWHHQHELACKRHEFERQQRMENNARSTAEINRLMDEIEGLKLEAKKWKECCTLSIEAGINAAAAESKDDEITRLKEEIEKLKRELKDAQKSADAAWTAVGIARDDLMDTLGYLDSAVSQHNHSEQDAPAHDAPGSA